MTEIKVCIVAIGTGLTAILGGWDTLLYAIISLIIIDYITGFLAAAYNQQLNSFKGYRGIIKKVLILIAIAMATTLDSAFNLADPWIRTAFIYFFIANEGLSIIENLSAAGIPIPQVVKDLLEQTKNKEGGIIGK